MGNKLDWIRHNIFFILEGCSFLNKTQVLKISTFSVGKRMLIMVYAIKKKILRNRRKGAIQIVHDTLRVNKVENYPFLFQCFCILKIRLQRALLFAYFTL